MEAIVDFIISRVEEAEKRNNLQIPQNLSRELTGMLNQFELACYCQGFSDGVMFNSGVNNF